MDKARDLAEVAADKAKNATDTAKLNMAILTEQRELEKNYRAIGEWFISEYTGEVPDAVKDVVAAVNASKARIAEMEAEKASKSAAPANEQTKEEENAVSVKVCPVCGAASEDKFCPHCGAPMGE
ncbi:MAG: zinc ribbon domain-containing protein [Firmicutes bacterium CAG:176_63_11]|nr:MAG: zinc ribbon domain-containing protein [Firmicutes bacterium CAG:176_63_11]